MKKPATALGAPGRGNEKAFAALDGAGGRVEPGGRLAEFELDGACGETDAPPETAGEVGSDRARRCCLLGEAGAGPKKTPGARPGLVLR